MSDNPNGIIKYGSGHSSVLFDCSLTDTTEITAKSGTVQSGASISSAGVMCGSAGGIGFDLSGLDAAIKAQMQYTGQISVDVLAKDFGTHRAVERSQAIDRVATGYFANWNSSAVVNLPMGSMYITSANNIVGYSQQTNETALSNTSFRSHEAIGNGNDGYVTVTVSWNGTKTQLYYNGVLDSEKSKTTSLGGIFEFIMLGALVNGSSPLNTGTLKNVVMSSQPVQFATHPKLANILCVGDSLFAQSATNASYGAGVYNSIESYFTRKGLKCNVIEAAVGGASILDTTGNNINSQLTGTNGLDATHPKIVCYRGGTNDAIAGYTIADVEADIKGHITTALASADHIIIGTTPSVDIRNGGAYANDAVRIAAINTLNAVIITLSDWWDTNNPADTGRVHIVDEFTAFGGHNPPVGSVEYDYYLTGDYHPNGWGHWKQGELYANKIESLLS